MSGLWICPTDRNESVVSSPAGRPQIVVLSTLCTYAGSGFCFHDAALRPLQSIEPSHFGSDLILGRIGDEWMMYSDTKGFVAGERVERRLAAILVADVVGYSGLMHREEEATHARLSTLLTGTILPAITGHGGRVVKNTGDGFLAEFPS